jgi:hypothetical protein
MFDLCSAMTPALPLRQLPELTTGSADPHQCAAIDRQGGAIAISPSRRITGLPILNFSLAFAASAANQQQISSKTANIPGAIASRYFTRWGGRATRTNIVSNCQDKMPFRQFNLAGPGLSPGLAAAASHASISSWTRAKLARRQSRICDLSAIPADAQPMPKNWGE